MCSNKFKNIYNFSKILSPFMEPKKTSNLIREASHAGSWYTDSSI